MLFWMARRTVRSCTGRSSGGGGGCLVMLLGFAVISGLTSQTQPPQPVQLAAAPGWAPGPNGTFIPIRTPAPGVAAVAPTAPTQQTGMLLAIGAVIVVLAVLAFIGSRMTPVPIKVKVAANQPDFRPCCGVPLGAAHNTWCHTRRPPDDHGQAWYSNRR